MKKMLYILGDECARITGKQPSVIRGMLRLAAQEECSAEDPTLVEAYIESLSFYGWQRVLNNKSFYVRLSNIGVTDVPKVIMQAHSVLVERQSLFTLAVR